MILFSTFQHPKTGLRCPVFAWFWQPSCFFAIQKTGTKKSGFQMFPAVGCPESGSLLIKSALSLCFQGGNAAKTLLFKASQLKPTSMDGLLALCILGIKQSDGSLINAALGEMEKRLDEKGGAEYSPDYVSIKALTLVLQGKKADAR